MLLMEAAIKVSIFVNWVSLFSATAATAVSNGKMKSQYVEYYIHVDGNFDVGSSLFKGQQ
jgi:hypothetical protein